MNVLGSSELKTRVFDRDLCIGCGACVSLCPYFKSYNGKTAMLFPCTQPQGRCFAYCPKVDVDLDEVSNTIFGRPYSADPLGHYRAIMVSRAGKNMLQGNFQSGGTASALIYYSLEKKLINAAILTGSEGLNPSPSIVTSSDDVMRYASSKYASAPTLAAFNQAVQKGYTDIGVVATPCQALALARMRCNPMKATDFTDPTALVVGLFCTWSIDYRHLRELVRDLVDISDIKKFDIPPPPADVFEIHTSKGTINIPLAEMREHVPNSCGYCFDMTSEFADISVGVLEGHTDKNTLIVRTERGEKIVKGAVNYGYLEISDFPQEAMSHLKTAAGNKKRRALEKARDEKMVNTATNGKRAYPRLKSANC